MSTLKASARRAGLLYLVFSLSAIVGEFAMPTFIVPGNPSATAGRIVASEFMYRLDIFMAIVTHVLFLLVVLSLYDLFKDVSRSLARHMVLFVSIGLAAAFAGLLFKFAPLVLLSGTSALTALSRPQLETLAFLSLRLNGQAAAVPTVFWGLWLFPFGKLVCRSGFFPRILGALLIAAGVGYLVSSITSIVLPEYRAVVARAMMPLYFGELPIILWLLVVGAREPRVRVV